MFVTGGAGFIGSNFVHHSLREHPGERLVVLDALTYAGNLDSLGKQTMRPELRVQVGDICDTALVESLMRSERIDTIVHLAAESHVDRSISGPDEFIRTNIVGTHSLLKCARKLWLEEKIVAEHRFHHVSTDEVYGSLAADGPPFHEDTAYAPNSPYSASKAASDHLVRAYHHTYGLSVTTSNCSNNYGPYHFPEKLIPLTIVNILRGQSLPVYGDGRNVRDWLHVEDHCRAIDLVVRRGKAGETYNIGARAEVENIAIVRELCRTTDELFAADEKLRRRFPLAPPARGARSADLITFVTDRPGHDRRYAIDCGKIERELGSYVRIGLTEGLKQTVTWFIENEDWWQPLLAGRNRGR